MVDLDRDKLIKTIKSLEDIQYKLKALSLENASIYLNVFTVSSKIINENIDSVKASINKLKKLNDTHFN